MAGESMSNFLYSLCAVVLLVPLCGVWKILYEREKKNKDNYAWSMAAIFISVAAFCGMLGAAWMSAHP